MPLVTAGAGRAEDAQGRSRPPAAGTSTQAHSATQLGQVYKDLGHQLVYAKKFREVTVIFTLVAFIVILAGAALSVVWFRRLV